jgi:hypothetical protein
VTRRRVAAVVVLAVVVYLGGVGANFWLTARVVHGEQAAQRRAGQMVERKLCTTFGSLAALEPPPGNPHTNPSRGYLQAEHATLVQLGADLGCGGTR